MRHETLSDAEVRVRAARLAEALTEADPPGVRAAMAGLTPHEANAVARATAPLMRRDRAR